MGCTDLYRIVLRKAGGLGLAAALCFAAAPAGATGFTGYVMQEDGVTPIVSAKVDVVNPADDSVLTSVFTNGSGYYALTALAPGTYHIQTSPGGYFPAVRSSHTVASGQDISVDFALQGTVAEVFRDTFTANGWSLAYNAVDSNRLSSNGNVLNFGITETSVGGNLYAGITKPLTMSMASYPYVTVRNRYKRTSGTLDTFRMVFDNPGSWNFSQNLLTNTSQSWPWQDRTYNVTYSVPGQLLIILGDPSVATGVGDFYFDHIIIHSRARGYVSGQVRSLEGAPLSNARVQLRKGAAVIGEALSDASGAYEIWAATNTAAYNIYLATSAGVEFQSDSFNMPAALLQTQVNVIIDTAPAAVSNLAAAIAPNGDAQLTWMATGANGWADPLDNSTFTIQYATYTTVSWSTAAAQVIISTTGVPPASTRNYFIGGLPANTTHYFRLWTLDGYGTLSSLSNGATVATMMEGPSSVYIDEVGTTSIVASAYASTFTNINLGMSGVAVSTDMSFDTWGSTGNYWVAKANMLSSRYDLAGAAAGGKFYAVGGGGAGAKLNEVYDPVTNSWSSKAQMPTGRDRLYAAAIGGKIYAVGGYSGGPLSVTEVYDPAANSWVTKSSMPAGSAYGAAAAVNGKLYVMGGPQANYQYDPDSDTWISRADVPATRNYPAAAALNGKIYLVGGNYGSYLTINEEYDPVFNTWNTRAPITVARQSLMAVAAGGKLHAIGGFNGVELDTHEEYDPLSNSWTVKPGVPLSRYRAAAAAVDGKIYIAGGGGGGDSTVEYNPGVSRKVAGLRPNTLQQFAAKSRNQDGLVGAQSMPWVSTYTLAAVGLPWYGGPVFNTVQPQSFMVNWASGTPSSYNEFGASYKVQVSTLPDFSVLAGNITTNELAYSFYNLSPNTTHYARVQAYNTGGMTDYSWLALGSTVTAIEQPTSVYVDEVSSWSITASAYASTFTGLGTGLSAVNITTDAAYGAWTAGIGWFPGSNMVSNRHGAAGAALGGKIYVMGGTFDGTNSYGSVEVYDPALNSWGTTGSMLTSRYSLGAAVAAGKIYAVGGYNNSGQELNNNEEYDPAAGAWSARAPMPTERERLAVAALRGKIYAIGGQESGGTSAKNEEYDPAADRWKTKAPLGLARNGLAAAAANERIYAVGGYNVGYQGAVEQYDPSSDTWVTRPSLPTPRRGLALAAIGNKLYAASGFDGSYLGVTEVYDLNFQTWAPGAPMPAPREGMAYAAAGGMLYLAGGNDGGYLNTAYRFNPGVSKTFTGLGPNRQYSLKAKARNQAGAETGETGTYSVYTLAVATVPEFGASAIVGVGYSTAAVQWSSGTQQSGYNYGGVTYQVQASSTPDFSGDIKFGTTNDPYYNFSWLEDKTTYYFRVQASNLQGVSDYSWTLLGSTFTPAAPLDGVEISSVANYLAWEDYTWPRTMARDSDGNLYTAYARKEAGRDAIFVARSADNGETWAETTASPVEVVSGLPGAASYNQRWPSLAVDSNDVLHLVWGGISSAIDPAENKLVYTFAAAPGSSWAPYQHIPGNAYEGWEGPFTLAVDSADGLHVAWGGEDGGGLGTYRVRYSSRAANEPWSAYVPVGDDGKYASYASMAVDSHDGVHLLAHHASAAGTNTATQIVYSSRTQFTGWGAWTVVYDGGAYWQSPPSLTMTPSGGLFAAWSSADVTHANSQIKFSTRAFASAGWSPMAYASDEPQAPQSYPAAAADSIGSVYVLWSGSDSVNSAVNLKGSVYDGFTWDTIDKLTDETTGYQTFAGLRWSGWRNNGGGLDVLWNTWDGVSSTAALRHMQGPDVPMSPGWSAVDWPKPADCAFAINVRQDGTGDFTGIQQALAAVPHEVSTNSCVVVRDAETYREQVRVEGFRFRWEAPARLFIMADPTFVSSAPVVRSPGGTAFSLLSTSVTVQGFIIDSTTSLSYGVFASSEYARLSNLLVSGEFSMAGVKLSGRSGIYFSTVAGGGSADGIRLEGPLNEVRNSSASSTYNMHSPLYLNYSSSNTIADSYFYQHEGNAVTLYYSDNNTISYSTITGNMSSYAGLYLSYSDRNDISRSYISNRDGYGANLSYGSDHNTISQSTMATAGMSNPALYIYDSDTNTVTASNIVNTAGPGAELYWNSENNTVSSSSISGAGSFYFGFRFNNSDYNTLVRSRVENLSGPGLGFDGNADYNNVFYSTVTGGAASHGIRVYGSTSSITSSFVQGSTAVVVSASGVVMVRDSSLFATGAAGHGFYSSFADAGVYLASSTFSGGISGSGIYLNLSNSGKHELSSNTIVGGAYGVSIATVSYTGDLRISTITFRALTPGATAINFISGYFVSTITAADFESPNIDVTVDGRYLGGGSRVTLRSAAGAKAGPDYETDPYNWVAWPSATAQRVGPENWDMDLPQNPALFARALETGATVQYQYQLDTVNTMNSQGAAPLHSFSQPAAQVFGAGAFSGQDAQTTLANDSYLSASTAAFVFLSTGPARLSSYTWYYWRARAKASDVGYFGEWTSTATFKTGAPASEAPVNNLAVNDVWLSSATGVSARIDFRLRANDTNGGGLTPGGGSWKTADWVFVKFSTQAGAEGTWNHATLSTGAVGVGGDLVVSADRKGAFIDHSMNYSFWTSTAYLRWNYAADGITNIANAQVKVFAYSMIKVGAGPFVYNVSGLGGSASNNYGGGGQVTVNSVNDIPAGAPAGWPNGYDTFYLMRYEVSQGQYADFLNTLPAASASALYASETGYGHQMGNGGVYPAKYYAADRFAAKNYLSTDDLWSFLSWSGLRPMTEMEFEKAARDRSPDVSAYPWGSTAPVTAVYSPVNEGGEHTRYHMNYNSVAGGQKVLQVGRYAGNDLFRDNDQYGISPYVIFDLAGNVWEHVLNCSHPLVPANGNGTESYPSSWPGGSMTAKGLRGGGWSSAGGAARVSDRVNASWPNSSRDSGAGGRGVRAP